eukprot:jgi/Botrbrau1/6334/Bobra.0339s0041.1
MALKALCSLQAARPNDSYNIGGMRHPAIRQMDAKRAIAGSPLLPPRPYNVAGRRSLKMRPAQASLDDIVRFVAKSVTVPIASCAAREERIHAAREAGEAAWQNFIDGELDASGPSPTTVMAGVCAFLMVAAITLDGRGMMLVSWYALRHVLPLAYVGFVIYETLREAPHFRASKLAWRLALLAPLMALVCWLKKLGGDAMTSVSLKYPPFYEGVVDIPAQAAQFIKLADRAGANIHQWVTVAALGLAAALVFMVLKRGIASAGSLIFVQRDKLQVLKEMSGPREAERDEVQLLRKVHMTTSYLYAPYS